MKPSEVSSGYGKVLMFQSSYIVYAIVAGLAHGYE